MSKILKNLTSVYVSHGIAGITGLVSIPIVLKNLGTEAYGVYALCLVFLSQLGFLSLGISQTIMKSFIETKKDDQKFSEAITCVCILSMAIGLLGVGITALLTMIQQYDLPFCFKKLSPEYIPLILITGIIFFFQVISNALCSIEECKENFVKIGALDMMERILRNLGLIVISFICPKVVWALYVWVGVMLLKCIVLFCWGRKELICFKISSFSMSRSIQIISFGWKIGLTQGLGVFIATFDRVALGIFTPLETVGIYSAAFDLASRIQLLSNGANRVFYPRFVKMYHGNMQSLLRENYLTLQKILLYSLIIIPLFLIPFSKLIFINSADSQHLALIADVFSVLLFGFMLTGICNLPYNALLAFGQSKHTLIIHIIIAGMVAVLMPFAALWFKSRGVAYAYLFVHIIDFWLLNWFLEKTAPYIFQHNKVNMLCKTTVFILAVLCLSALSGLGLFCFKNTDYTLFLFLLTILGMMIHFFKTLEPYEQKYIKMFFRKTPSIN